MPQYEDELGRPIWWPYDDLELLSPKCPLCGSFATLFVGLNLHPQAWCVDDECPAFTWDPSLSPAYLREHVQEIDVEPGGI